MHQARRRGHCIRRMASEAMPKAREINQLVFPIGKSPALA
jgi:hypothetical protein